MARSNRVQAAGILRHVMARGNGRMQIFLDDMDYRKFIALLGNVLEELDVECWNYCVMPNHYHATLRPTRPNLSEAIRRINGSYAQWWNKRHDRVGHVFQGRFKDQIVQRDGYLVALCRYVALNPIRAGLAQRPEDWEWSSYSATLGLHRPPSFLAVSSVLRQFGEGDVETLRARFSAYVLCTTQHSMDDRIRSSEPALGDKPFKDTIRLLTGGEKPSDGAAACVDRSSMISF